MLCPPQTSRFTDYVRDCWEKPTRVIAKDPSFRRGLKQSLVSTGIIVVAPWTRSIPGSRPGLKSAPNGAFSNEFLSSASDFALEWVREAEPLRNPACASPTRRIG